MPTLEAQDIVFKAPIHIASWQVAPPYPLHCEMSQQIPNYGIAIFMHHAGRKPAFKMMVFQAADQSATGKLHSQPPAWSYQHNEKPLGAIKLYSGRTIFRLSHEKTRQLMVELLRGWSPTFYHADLNYSDNLIKAQLSAINFRQAYSRYLICLAQLLPYGFHTIKRMTIYYGSGSDQLNAQDRAMLERILRYYAIDPSIRKIVLRGFSDSAGTRRDNYLLSIRRLRNIEQFLKAGGIPEEKIDAIAFGERRPAATNRTVKGRALNRRVHVVLHK